MSLQSAYKPQSTSLQALSPILSQKKRLYSFQSDTTLNLNSKLEPEPALPPTDSAYNLRPKSLTVQGHRGAGDKHNTIFAFKSAIDYNLHFAELDVWQTKDYELVVIHGEGDDGLIEFQGEKVRIISLTLAELQNLYKQNKQKQKQELNTSYSSYQSAETDIESIIESEEQDNYVNRIPSLKEVFQICKNKIKLNIELKGAIDDQLYVKQVLDLIQDFGMQNQVEISSFKFVYHDIVKSLIAQYNLDHKIPFGYLVEFSNEIPDKKEYDDLAGNSINFPPSFLECEVTVQKLKQLYQEKNINLTCYFNYDNNEFEEIYDRLREIGVSTIITNQPETINAYRNKHNLFI